MEINPMKDHEQSLSIVNEQAILPQNNTVKASKDSTSEIQVLGFNDNQLIRSEDLREKPKKSMPKRGSCHVQRMGEKYSCNLCDKQFKSVKAVYGHLRRHKEPKKAVTLNERLNVDPICKKKRSLRKRRTCFSSSNFNNLSLFNLKSSSSMNENDVDEEMAKVADILLLFASHGVVFKSVKSSIVLRETESSHPGRKRKIEEDDQGLIKTFKKRRFNLTLVSNGDDDNENGTTNSQ